MQATFAAAVVRMENARRGFFQRALGVALPPEDGRLGASQSADRPEAQRGPMGWHGRHANRRSSPSNIARSLASSFSSVFSVIASAMGTARS